MATYGRGQMLGSGINPESFKQDFSGFANAAAIQAQGVANLGKSIGDTITNLSEIKKENKRVDAMNKAAAKSIEAAITLGNSYGISGANETLSPFLAAANDPNLSSIEKAALLSEAKAMIPNVFSRFDNSQEMALRQAQIDKSGGSARQPNLKLDSIEEVINGQVYKIPVKFDPLDGTTRRLDGTIVGVSPMASAIDSAANIPMPSAGTGMQATAADINNALPLPSDQPSEEDLTGSSVLPLYTDDTSQLPPVGNVPDSQQPQEVGVSPSSSPTYLPPGAVPVSPKTSQKFRPATEEESKSFGSLKGQIDESTGRFYPLQESSPKLKLELLKEASKLYSEGKKPEALQYATAAGIGGLFGNLTIDDLDSYFASGDNVPQADVTPPQPEAQPAPTTQAQPRTPLDRIFGNSSSR